VHNLEAESLSIARGSKSWCLRLAGSTHGKTLSGRGVPRRATQTTMAQGRVFLTRATTNFRGFGTHML
jgi:hypothetical protein